MADTKASMLVPGMVAGAVAAGVWAAAEPVAARMLNTAYTDVRFLGGVLTGRGSSGATRRSRRGRSSSGRWPAGLAWHLANGAAFGAAFSWLGGRGWKQGLAAAQAENALTWPLLPLVSRRHPRYRSVRWCSPLGGRIFAQEAAMHALFGAMLGSLASLPGRHRAPDTVSDPGQGAVSKVGVVGRPGAVSGHPYALVTPRWARWARSTRAGSAMATAWLKEMGYGDGANLALSWEVRASPRRP